MNSSTVYGRTAVDKFLDNPINCRVVLPDGSLGMVRQVQDTDQGRFYKVQGIDSDGHFRAYQSISCWFSVDELRLVYFSVGLHQDWLES